MPRFNHAEISASCVHLYSISLIVRLVGQIEPRRTPPGIISLARRSSRKSPRTTCWPTVLGVLDKQIRWHVPSQSPLSGDYSGHEEVLGFFKKSMELSGGPCAWMCMTSLRATRQFLYPSPNQRTPNRRRALVWSPRLCDSRITRRCFEFARCWI